jgi:MFS transporter, PPP family, 3-phenylpropionic acid transporter
MDLRSPKTAHLSVLELFFWGSILAIEGFMVPYLVGIGFTERQAGLVMAAIFLISVGSAPLWGYIADRTNRHQRIILFSLSIGIAAVLAIAASGPAIKLIVLFALIYSLTANSMPAIIDSWMMTMSRAGSPITYGIARGFGSFGFALSGAVLGIVLERHGLILLFPIYAGLTVIVILVTLAIRVPSEQQLPDPRVAEHEAGSSAGAAVRAVLANGKFLVLLASCFFVLLGTRAALTFLPIRIYSLGGTTVHVGWSQSIFAASEIPFMFLSAFLVRRLRPRPVILAGMIFFVIRLVLMRLAPNPEILLAVQVVHGASFGLVLPATVHYIDRLAPPQFRSLFQTLAPSVYFGLASAVGSSIGGAVIERFGLDVLYTGAPVVSAVGVLLFAGSMIAGGKRTRIAPGTASR